MQSVDAVVIGAGVVGLAVASELELGDVYVLERNSSFGQETSSRNSEVIHAGIYYTKDSLKAKLCLDGKHLLYEIAKRHDLPFKNTGKIIVATDEYKTGQLESLLEKARNNGVTDLRMLSADEVLRLEPNVRAVAGLYSPSTGIIDSHKLMEFFLGKTKNKGANFVYNTAVVGIEKLNEHYKVTVVGNDGEQFFFLSRCVINSAGLFADRIAELAGIDIDDAGYRLHFCKGEYFSVRRQGLVSRLIYPVPPNNNGLGAHVIFDLGGRIKLGPTTHYLKSGVVDYSVDVSHCKEVYDSVKRFLPCLSSEDLEPDTAGIRPRLYDDNGLIRDFIIQEETARGLPGFVNLIGIESPGLTASPAIAKYVANIIHSHFERRVYKT